ncbi:hypothetical protein UA08_07497 [Talaromyces atroroseus]|uniref:Xylanolytic transcriptional activator regulatory domain-containing protein n=1 Tax=Talaromyces atroroseus TaxID=1441469 RepID=A0A225AV02_TALAT|nr:hypothetical protein UA08_07497 [Talaromyces atroroseus]OKL57307.1 hypothetical protein UA08_07497 [Talaromyces atroroseus]
METSKPKRQKVPTACDPCRSRKSYEQKFQPRSPHRLSSEMLGAVLVAHAKQVPHSVWPMREKTQKRNCLYMGYGLFAHSSCNRLPNLAQAYYTADVSPVATSIVPLFVQPLPETLESTDSTFISNNHSAHDIVVGDGHIHSPASSPIARTLMQEVEKMVKEKLGEASSARGPYNDSRQNDLDYPLPARQQADNLLSSYWNYVHVLYPFLDKPQTEEDYANIWNQENFITNKKSFLCLLNSIFAISSRHVRLAAPDDERLAATFCQRARELMDIESYSICLVQSYLLLALYFQSIDEPRTCWMFVGLAIRTAQVLEFHLIETSEQEPDNRTTDLFRKVWLGCVLMDREVSMMYGRPCMIDHKTAAAVPLPLLEEEIFQLGHVQSHNTQAPQTHAADFYSISLRLYDILHDVLHHTYPGKSQGCSNSAEYCSPFEANTFVVELEERLSRWEDKIPNYYKSVEQSFFVRGISMSTYYC